MEKKLREIKWKEHLIPENGGGFIIGKINENSIGEIHINKNRVTSVLIYSPGETQTKTFTKRVTINDAKAVIASEFKKAIQLKIEFYNSYLK